MTFRRREFEPPGLSVGDRVFLRAAAGPGGWRATIVAIRGELADIQYETGGYGVGYRLSRMERIP